MDTRKQVSLRIQQLCAAHGYNINSLARKSGIPPTTLKNIIAAIPELSQSNFSVMVWAFPYMTSLIPVRSRLLSWKI